MPRLSLLVALAALLTSSVVVATTTLTASGTVTHVSAIQNADSVPIPPGSITIGDTFTLFATFDASLAELTALYDADPTINVYFLPGTTVSYSIGKYSPIFPPLYNFNASTQLWNDFELGGPPVDSQTFSFFEYNVSSALTLPFDLGVGEQSVFLDLYAFDPSANARSNDLITQYAPFSSFPSKTFGFGQFNSDTNLSAFVQGDIVNWTISTIPEPDTWALMIFGLGAVGIGLRRRNARPVDVPLAARERLDGYELLDHRQFAPGPVEVNGGSDAG